MLIHMHDAEETHKGEKETHKREKETHTETEERGRDSEISKRFSFFFHFILKRIKDHVVLAHTIEPIII